MLWSFLSTTRRQGGLTTYAAGRCSSPQSQRHGWARGEQNGPFAWPVRQGRRQSRVHSKIRNQTLSIPFHHIHPPARCTVPAHYPSLNSAVHLPLDRAAKLPIFSWGRYHERYCFREDPQAMCAQIA